MDDVLLDLLETNFEKAVGFFYDGLREVSDQKNKEQMEYVAGVLARYSLVHRMSEWPMAPMANLSEVFENFYMRLTDLANDPKILEAGGSQIILLAGYFRNQMKRRHNVVWFDEMGQFFYTRAGECSLGKKSKFFFGLSGSLPQWNIACCKLSDYHRENRFIIKVD